jgi:hypothetical protein
MNRKEDLMRRLSGGKTGSKTGRIKNSCVLFFLFFSSQIFSQIPINGFCLLDTLGIPKGYQNVISTDLNFDDTDELICYSDELKNIVIISAIHSKEKLIKEFKVNNEISQLLEISNTKDSIKLFAVVERKLRKVSLLSISPDTVRENLGEITFDSYPEKISAADIDLNGEKEMLISGSGFDGLSILFRSANNIGEKKVITGTSFSNAVFADLNNDGYPDIAAFNILDNSLQLFFNNTNGDFRLRRTIPFDEKISQLQTFDVDKDGFKDIIYSINNRIEILFGDFQSAFEKKKSIQLKEIPFRILFGDFNKDGYPDLACLAFQDKIIIFFGKPGGSFYDGITYLKSPVINSVAKFTSEKTDNIVCLLESGELKFIEKLYDFDSPIDLVPSVQADAVKKFDYGNDAIKDISFIDGYNNTLRILLRNKDGIPSSFYSFPLVENHQEIIVDEFFKFRKIFYCYSRGTPLLEVINFDFRANKLNRKQLYAPGEILDITLQRVDSTFVNVFLAYLKNSKLYVGKFENRDLSITFKEYPLVDRNVTQAKIFIDQNPEVYYWKKDGLNMEFKMAEILSGPNDYTDYFQIPQSDSLSISLFGMDNLNREYPSLVSLVINNSQNYCLVLTSGNLNVRNLEFNPASNGVKNFGRGKFSETSVKGIINFTLSSEDGSVIYRMNYNENNKSYSLRKLLDAENVSDYFFTRLDKKNYYLVYSNKKDGCLSIIPLKK